MASLVIVGPGRACAIAFIARGISKPLTAWSYLGRITLKTLRAATTSSGASSDSLNFGVCGIRKFARSARELVHSQQGWRGAQRARYEDRWRTRGHTICRPSSTTGTHAAVGKREERQGISRDAWAQVHRRHLQRGTGRAVSLERFSPE